MTASPTTRAEAVTKLAQADPAALAGQSERGAALLQALLGRVDKALDALRDDMDKAPDAEAELEAAQQAKAELVRKCQLVAESSRAKGREDLAVAAEQKGAAAQAALVELQTAEAAWERILADGFDWEDLLTSQRERILAALSRVDAGAADAAAMGSAAVDRVARAARSEAAEQASEEAALLAPEAPAPPTASEVSAQDVDAELAALRASMGLGAESAAGAGPGDAGGGDDWEEDLAQLMSDLGETDTTSPGSASPDPEPDDVEAILAALPDVPELAADELPSDADPEDLEAARGEAPVPATVPKSGKPAEAVAAPAAKAGGDRALAAAPEPKPPAESEGRGRVMALAVGALVVFGGTIAALMLF